MILLTDTDHVPKEKTACALGLFDGVHRGHQMIINEAVSAAKEKGVKSAVFSFKTNTVTSKGHDGRIEMLMSDDEKHEKMERLGVDYIFSPDFESFKGMPPENFVRDIIRDKLNCICAVCGTDFTFGRGAVGKADDLVRIGKKYGIEVIVLDKLAIDGEEVSSTVIRKYIRTGLISKANKLLGRRFGFDLEVEHGFQRGRTWDFPTINQKIPKGRVMPRFGVYCSKVLIDGKWYRGVTNIGIKPTVNEIVSPLAETFIIDYNGNLYGKKIKFELFEFLRPERKFDSFDELKQEILKNTQQTIRYFNSLEAEQK